MARAAQLLGASETLRQTIGTPLPPIELAAHQRVLAGVQDKAWSENWACGAALPLDEAVALGLKAL
jgi:hypothetical protein